MKAGNPLFKNVSVNIALKPLYVSAMQPAEVHQNA
jgi:hypothetical protein